VSSVDPVLSLLWTDKGTDFPGKVFYTFDNLGNIRELINEAGNVACGYEYDPYGRRTLYGQQLSWAYSIPGGLSGSGTFESDLGFTGHYHHSPSGLTLAPYRAYDANFGRWLSRDPIEEEGGLNLYSYTFNNPVNWVDPLGLDVWYENTTAVNGWHRRVSVTDPSSPTGKTGQSFGQNTGRTGEGSSAASGDNPAPGKSGSGIVYPDNRDPATKEVERFKTTPAEDKAIKDALSKELGNTGNYNPLSNSCRDYSKDAFNRMKNMTEHARKAKP